MNYDLQVLGNIVSILICATVLYGYIFETRVKDVRRKSMIYAILCILLGSISDCALFFYGEGLSENFLRIFNSLDFTFMLLFTSCLLNYLYHVAKTKNINCGRMYHFFLVYSIFVSGMAFIIGMTEGLGYFGENGVVYTKYSFIIFCFEAIIYIFLLAFLIINIKKIKGHELFSFLVYMFTPFIFYSLRLIEPKMAHTYLGYAFAILFVYVTLQAKLFDQTEHNRLRYFSSIGAIYNTMHIINLNDERIYEIGCNSIVHDMIEEKKNERLQNIMNAVMKSRICEAHLRTMLDFVNLSTLGERMKGRLLIQQEVINAENKWIRFGFVRIGNLDEKLEEVVFTSMDIDSTKRKESELLLMSCTDELTQLYNRHAYEEQVYSCIQDGIREDFWYMNIDVNGLKEVNDRLGHSAGDELIIATAKIISKAVNGHGHAYRIGGDEFVCMLRASGEEVDKILTRLETERKKWKGAYNNELSFSKGIVGAFEIPGCTMYELEREADERMYDEKRAYHNEHGVRDRRQR